jgi:outer membrane usher protein
MFRTHAVNAPFAFTLGLCALSSMAVAQSVAPDVATHAVILGVILNGAPVSGGETFLEDSDAHLLASATFLQRWNLRAGSVPAHLVDGVAYFDLQDVPGLQVLRDTARAEVTLVADRGAFKVSAVNANAQPLPAVQPYVPGGFVNYDLAITQTPLAASQDALLGIGLFAGTGLVTHNMALHDASSVRLMSSYQTDMPQTMKTLRLGDSINTTGAWGLGVLFGGVQYGTNFAVRPDFIAQSMPSVTGDALLPSTVDVYVNNVLRSRQGVEAGPFAIQNLPLVNGQGDMQVVVRDLLGREQVITQPFMASPNVLREGLVQEAYELGALRRNYGLQSDEYGGSFASLTWRKGMNNRWTSELRAEVQRQTHTVGIANAVLLPQWSSVLETTLAASGGAQEGGMLSALYSYTGDKLAVNARATVTSAGFRQLGTDLNHLPARLASLQAAIPLGTGTLVANYLNRQGQADEQVHVLTLSYSQRLSENVFATFSVLNASAITGVAVLAGITVLLDQKHFSNASVNHSAHADTAYVDYAQVADSGEGVGYRLAATQGDANARQDAAFTSNHSHGSWGADASQQNGTTSTRLWATGGVASLGNGVYFSRGIAESFAIVQVGQTADVPVYLESQLVARTSTDGSVLVNNLRAYQDNRVSIDPLTVPLDQSLGTMSQIVQPRLLGGVQLDFAVHPVIGLTLTLQQDGSALAPWTPVQVPGLSQSFVVGRRGEVFVEFPLAGHYRLVAKPVGRNACSVDVEVKADGALPGFGPCQ